MHQELGIVGRSMLTGVALSGEARGRPRQRQMVEEGEMWVVVGVHAHAQTYAPPPTSHVKDV